MVLLVEAIVIFVHRCCRSRLVIYNLIDIIDFFGGLELYVESLYLLTDYISFQMTFTTSCFEATVVKNKISVYNI